jgi:hypothetical protein
MPRQYIKTKGCGCVVKAVSLGVENNHNGKMYMLGGHKHLIICDTCKKMEMEDCDEDTLYDMWMNDDMTNDFRFAGWEQYDGNKIIELKQNNRIKTK